MYVIQQEELFSFEQLMGMQAETKYSAILDHLPINMILHAISKVHHRGRPESVNTRAMIYSLVIGKMEHMLFVKDIVRRLTSSAEFRQLCRFTGSDRIPSEASYSRLITKLYLCGVLSDVQDQIVVQSVAEGFISGESLAVDSSHIEAWDRNPRFAKPKKDDSSAEISESTLLTKEQCTPVEPQKLSKPVRNKTGRVPKAEAQAWQEKLEAYEASLPLFERKVAAMLPFTYEELLAEMPQYPSTGAKGDPRGTGRVMYWYGYKANLLVDTQSQYIVNGLFCSAHVHDQRLAIVLLKRLKQKLPTLKVKHVLADKGYDSYPVYRQARELGAFALIPLIHRLKKLVLPEGMDENYSPLCEKGHAYRYDSFDAKYETLKYTRPKECGACPLQDKGCQKVHKIRIEKDIRLHTFPARGSEKYTTLFKRRTAIERVFAYLKLYFGMGCARRSKTRLRTDFDLSCLTYNLCKYALDKLNKELALSKQVA